MASAICSTVSGVVPFCEGWRPVVLGDANPDRMASAIFLLDSGVVPFCEGGRPVVYGTPTLTEWPMPFFFLFLVYGLIIYLIDILLPFRQPADLAYPIRAYPDPAFPCAALFPIAQSRCGAPSAPHI